MLVDKLSPQLATQPGRTQLLQHPARGLPRQHKLQEIQGFGQRLG